MKIIILFISFLVGIFGQAINDRGEGYYKVIPGKYNYIVTIYLKLENRPPAPVCIGTIIDAKGIFVATSCRCLLSNTDVALGSFYVMAGDVNTRPDLHNKDTFYRQTRTIYHWEPHPYCSPQDKAFFNLYSTDYSLIQLDAPFVFNGHIGWYRVVDDYTYMAAKIDYYTKSQNTICRRCRVVGRMTSGYNATLKTYRSYSKNLWATIVYIMDVHDCERILCRQIKCRPNELQDRQWICAQTSLRGRKICDGDRGAPLVCQGKIYGFFLGETLLKPCGDPNTPLLFAPLYLGMDFHNELMPLNASEYAVRYS